MYYTLYSVLYPLCVFFKVAAAAAPEASSALRAPEPSPQSARTKAPEPSPVTERASSRYTHFFLSSAERSVREVPPDPEII